MHGQSCIHFVHWQTPSHQSPLSSLLFPRNTHSWWVFPNCFLSGSPTQSQYDGDPHVCVTLVPVSKVPGWAIQPTEVSLLLSNTASYPGRTVPQQRHYQLVLLLGVDRSKVCPLLGTVLPALLDICVIHYKLVAGLVEPPPLRWTRPIFNTGSEEDILDLHTHPSPAMLRKWKWDRLEIEEIPEVVKLGFYVLTISWNYSRGQFWYLTRIYHLPYLKANI